VLCAGTSAGTVVAVEAALGTFDNPTPWSCSLKSVEPAIA
jgi:hypothetical protein